MVFPIIELETQHQQVTEKLGDEPISVLTFNVITLRSATMEDSPANSLGFFQVYHFLWETWRELHTLPCVHQKQSGLFVLPLVTEPVTHSPVKRNVNKMGRFLSCFFVPIVKLLEDVLITIPLIR